MQIENNCNVELGTDVWLFCINGLCSLVSDDE